MSPVGPVRLPRGFRGAGFGLWVVFKSLHNSQTLFQKVNFAHTAGEQLIGEETHCRKETVRIVQIWKMKLLVGDITGMKR